MKPLPIFDIWHVMLLCLLTKSAMAGSELEVYALCKGNYAAPWQVSHLLQH